MSAFLDEVMLIVATNATVATVVAVGACLALRLHRPRLAHALCLFGLLKLITPPLVRVPLPDVAVASPPLAASPVLDDLDLLAVASLALDRDDVAAPSAVDPRLVVLLAAAAGTLLMLLAVSARAWRFRRLLRLAQPATPALTARAFALAERMRLGRCPDLLLVRARISPMLCILGGRARIVLPESLLRSAPPAQVDALLAHELAHAARRDHWVRVLEVSALCATWWLPTTWWLRRSLRTAEERCCDAQVLAALPHSPRTYADALLTTLDFLAQRQPAMPPLACGASAFHDMKTRLTTIMTPVRTVPIPGPARAALLACAAAVLPLAPTTAQDTGAEETKMRAELRAAMDEITQLRAELEQMRAGLRAQRGRGADAGGAARAERDAKARRETEARAENDDDARAEGGRRRQVEELHRELTHAARHLGDEAGELGAHAGRFGELIDRTVKAEVERALARMGEHGAFDHEALERRLAEVGEKVGERVRAQTRDLAARIREQVGNLDAEQLRERARDWKEHAQVMAERAREAIEARQPEIAARIHEAQGQYAKALEALHARHAAHAADQAAKQAAEEHAAHAHEHEAQAGQHARGASDSDEVQDLRAEVRNLRQRLEALTRQLERQAAAKKQADGEAVRR